MRVPRLPKHLALTAALLAVAATAADASGPGSAASDVSCCLNGSALAQRLHPTFTGDMSFFASQTNDPPNVVFILDNSTSMLELQLPLAAFPNASFIASGITPIAATGSDVASCHANTYFEGLKYQGSGAGSGAAFASGTTYPVFDPAFASAFATNSYYKYMEWTASAPGGSSSAATACAAMDNNPGTGGPGSMTQRQRCAQCLDEAGYYIKPGATSSLGDVGAGKIVFKGNFLNFFPPKYLVARKILTDFISQQSTTRVGVVTYSPSSSSATNLSPGSGMRAGDGGAFVNFNNGMTPNCNQATWLASDRTGLISQIRTQIAFGAVGGPYVFTPLAETLFNVGQYLAGDSNNTFYNSTFGSSPSWVKAGNPSSGGFTSAVQASNQRALCTACQVSAVVLITDGDPNGDNNLPVSTIRARNGGAVACGGTGCGTDPSNGAQNALADVAKLLSTSDLNPNLPGTQSAHTYTIGLGVDVPLLQAAATAGKGLFFRANSAAQLSDAINAAVLDISNRATAFSSTAIQTLEVGTGSSAFVPRFTPGAGAIWEGHLFRFDLFNEFVAGVDKNGDGNLAGVFLVDKDGDIVTENDRGEFLKQKDNTRAVPVWDAGALLQTRLWSDRTVYTALPTIDGSGKVTGWTRTPFTSDAATATALMPYLGLAGTNTCTLISQRIPGNPALTPLECAQRVIDYVRGRDVFGESTTTTNANRPFVLGDIFHSSPVVVEPPIDQFICELALHPQCVKTLFDYGGASSAAAPTPTDKYAAGSAQIDSYEKYFQDNKTRQKIALVGANDGMLHAFDAGTPDTPIAPDPTIPFRNIKYKQGTGNELWAFVTPDQLPRLVLMMTQGHQLYMDGDIMVRDIWVDGSGPTNHAGFKEASEFHTIAIAGEREGGTHFVALDVTDAANPQLRWVWPPPCSPEEQQWGQTWGQFAPRAPPIGPVLLETTAGAGITRYGVSTEERWSVLLNGGHDPYGTRGRALAMLDAWSGAPLYQVAYSPGATGPAGALQYGFPATAALVDFSHAGSRFDNDHFFDTAILGDEGGQVWVLRFGTPGHFGSGGLVDNWTFARAYEPTTASTKAAVDREPIYTVASTTVQTENGWLRAFVGTGDRSHLRSTGGGDCRPDSLQTCVEAGCSVTATVTLDNGPSRYVSTFQGSSGNFTAPTQVIAAQGSASCQLGDASLSINVATCGGGASAFSEAVAFSCAGSGAAYACTAGSFPTTTPTSNRGAAPAASGAGKFLGLALLTEGGIGSPARSRLLDTPGDAASYDTGRLQVSDLVDVSATAAANLATTGVTGNQANRSSAGWQITYPTVDEKTATSSTLLGGCVLWSSVIPAGGAGGCASAAAVAAPFYQADFVTGAPTCADSFRTATGYSRSLSRNVISPPPEPVPTIAIGAGGTSTRLSILEIQPGQNEVTQMNIAANTELLQLIYSIPLTAEQHQCRHIDPTSCP